MFSWEGIISNILHENSWWVVGCACSLVWFLLITLSPRSQVQLLLFPVAPAALTTGNSEFCTWRLPTYKKYFTLSGEIFVKTKLTNFSDSIGSPALQQPVHPLSEFKSFKVFYYMSNIVSCKILHIEEMKLASFLKINGWLTCSLFCHHVILPTFPDPSGRQESSVNKHGIAATSIFLLIWVCCLFAMALFFRRVLVKQVFDQVQNGRTGINAGGMSPVWFSPGTVS